MKTVGRSFGILTLITIIEKLLSFVFQSLIASNFGASIISDSYFSACELFTLIDSSILGALTVAVLNKITRISEQTDDCGGFNYISDIVSFAIPIMLFVSIITFLLAEPISFIIAPGYDQIGKTFLVRCIRLMALVPSIMTLSSICLAVLRYKKRFEITALRSFFISVTGITCLFFWSQKENADSLCIAFLLSTILFAAVLVKVSAGYGKIKIHLPHLTSEVRMTVHIMLPLIASYGITRLSLMFDRIMSSMFGYGAVSSLSYSHTLHNVVTAFFVTNICTILLTDFNVLYAKRNDFELTESLDKTIKILIIILLPITILTVFFSTDIVSFVFERGNFNHNNSIAVAGLLTIYALNFIPTMFIHVYNQVLYAVSDTRSAMQNSFISIFANIFLSLCFVLLIGLTGIALGTVISNLIGVYLSRRSVKSHFINTFHSFSINFLSHCFISTCVCIGVSLLINMFLSGRNYFSWVLCCIVSIFTYFGALYLLKNDVFLNCVSYITRRTRG